jgi:hypothetical protein
MDAGYGSGAVSRGFLRALGAEGYLRMAWPRRFGGFGVGIYRQSRGDSRENGTLKTFILGAKVKVGGLVVIRAEYRGISLAGTPLLDMDKRLSAGIGISF